MKIWWSFTHPHYFVSLLFFLTICLEVAHLMIAFILCRDVLSALGWRGLKELLALAGDFFIQYNVRLSGQCLIAQQQTWGIHEVKNNLKLGVLNESDIQLTRNKYEVLQFCSHYFNTNRFDWRKPQSFTSTYMIWMKVSSKGHMVVGWRNENGQYLKKTLMRRYPRVIYWTLLDPYVDRVTRDSWRWI